MKILPLKEQCYDLRAEVKRTGEKLLALRGDDEFSPGPMAPAAMMESDSGEPGPHQRRTATERTVPKTSPDYSEMNANLMLAYRALEDAAMRIGKLVQALDGGTSVYPR